MTYDEMAKRASPESAPELAAILLRIYEADRTENCGLVNGEAMLCKSFRMFAQLALTNAGVLDVVQAAQP